MLCAGSRPSGSQLDDRKRRERAGFIWSRLLTRRWMLCRGVFCSLHHCHLFFLEYFAELLLHCHNLFYYRLNVGRGNRFTLHDWEVMFQIVAKVDSVGGRMSVQSPCTKRFLLFLTTSKALSASSKSRVRFALRIVRSRRPRMISSRALSPATERNICRATPESSDPIKMRRMSIKCSSACENRTTRTPRAIAIFSSPRSQRYLPPGDGRPFH